MSDEKKTGVVVLWKNNDAYYELTPEKLTKWVEEGNEIFVRWKEKVKRVVSYHAACMQKACRVSSPSDIQCSTVSLSKLYLFFLFFFHKHD